MSVTLYNPVANIKSASPLFRDRNIAGVPIEVHEYTTPIVSTHAPYALVEDIAGLPWKVAALMAGKPLKEKEDNIQFLPQNIPDLPLPLPAVHEVLKKPLTDDEVKKYKLRKITAVKDRKNPIHPYSATNPSFDTLKFLAGREKVEKAIPMAGTGNVNMLRSFRHARRLIYAVSASVPLTDSTTYRMPTSIHSVKTYITDMDATVVPKESAVDGEGELKDGFDTYTTYYASAKVPTLQYITSPAKLGEFPYPSAILYPFFHGMLNANGNMVKNVLSRFNLYSSVSAETSAGLLGSLLQDIARPLNSRAGQELNHLAYGIIISLGKNVRPIPLIFGKAYVGFVLVSHHEFFALNQHGRLVKSVAPKDLVEEAASMSSHERAVETLAKMFSEMETDMGSNWEKEIMADELGCSRQVAEQLVERSSSVAEAGPATKLAFQRAITDLYFVDEHPLSLTFDIFKRWAPCVKDDTFFLSQYEDATDFVFLKGAGFTGDATVLNCAIFGGLGWSPLSPGGDKIIISDPSLDKIPERTLVKTPISLENGKVEYKDEYPLRYIIFHRVPIEQAAKDWEFVRKHGYITIPKKAPIKKDLAHKTFITEEIGEWWMVFRKNFYKPGSDALVGEAAEPAGVVVSMDKYRHDGAGDDF